MIFQTILPFIGQYGKTISFFGGFITGESMIVTLAFLSAQGVLPLWQVFVFCTLGMYLSDFIPLIIGRFKFFRKLFERKKFVKKIEKIEHNLQKYARNNLFLILFYSKFIYGLSIPALIYLGTKKTSYLKFAFYNFLVEIIFVPMVILIGWFSGRGFLFTKNIFKDIRIAIFLLIIFIILFIFIRRWWNQKLIKKQKP